MSGVDPDGGRSPRGGGPPPPGRPRSGGAGDARERRLDALREEARREGRVSGSGHEVRGGPIPAAAAGADRPGESGSGADRDTAGYYGQPVLKPPVWTWEVPVYFFVGGLAGMAGVLAAAARFVGGDPSLAVTALWVAAAGAVVSASLLISDLGRPARFLNMLRVFKRRSPMSVGAWTLASFGGASAVALALALASAEGLGAGAGGAPPPLFSDPPHSPIGSRTRRKPTMMCFWPSGRACHAAGRQTPQPLSSHEPPLTT